MYRFLRCWIQHGAAGRLVVALALAVCWAAAAAQTPQSVRMSSLEWPPYTGAKLAHQGASVVVVREVLRQAGLALDVAFFPWSRAVDMARRDGQTLAYFPEYFDPANAEKFLYSDPIGSGPLVFAQRRGAAVLWKQYDDLASVRIGVVRGYFNTPELDERIARGQLQADEAPDDSHNLRKLAAGRIDLAVIDSNVFAYLAQHDSAVAALAPGLEINAHVLENKRLYVCFKNSAQGRALRDVFNQALKRVNVEALMRQHLAASAAP